MEIIGSGQMTSNDVWANLKYSYKHLLKVTVGSVLIMACLVMVFVTYFLNTTYLGNFYSSLFEDYGEELWPLLAIIVTSAIGLFFIFVIMINSMRRFNRLKLGLRYQTNVLINPSGINICLERLGEREEYSIAWNTVEKIKIKKQYLHIYTKPSSKLHFLIPVRYFSDPNLLESIHQIPTIKEVKD